MAAYIIADVTVTDADKMAAYRVWSTKAMQEHGAEILVRGGDAEPLEGPWHPTRIVLLKFAGGREAAKAFYASEEYLAARQSREHAAKMNMIVVEGT